MKTISIGIPAYNEENNIYLLVSSILKQNQNNFILKEILIADDGSTDNTVQEIKKLRDKKIKIIKDKRRLGKVKRLNQMYSSFVGDIFIQFDADVIIKDSDLINKLTTAFNTDPHLDVVFGMQQPLQPETFVGELAYYGFHNWEIIKKYSKKNVDRYNTFGCITAFSRNYLEHYKIPEDKYVTEDTYSFYFAKKHNFKTHFLQDATVYFKLPQTATDYAHQMSRYISTNNDMVTMFDKALLSEYETLNTFDKIQGLFKNIQLSNIHIVICYIALQTFTKIQNKVTKQKIQWVIISTSKK